MYIKQPAHAAKLHSQAVKFSQNSLNLFNDLAQEASQGLPTSSAPLSQSEDVASRATEADDSLASGLEQKLGAVQYEQDRFHFAPELGPDFQGR